MSFISILYLLVIILVPGAVTKLIVSTMSHVSVTRGDNATLVCTFQNGSDIAQLKWTVGNQTKNCKNSSSVTDQTELFACPNSNDSCILTINQVEAADEGMYVCQGNDNSGSAFSSSQLIIQVPPEGMVISNQTHNFTEADTVMHVRPRIEYRIECSVYGSKPAAELHWIFDGRNVTDGVPNTTVTTRGNVWDSYSHLAYMALVGDDGLSLVCQANFLGSTIPTQERLLQLQVVRYATENYISTTLPVTTFATSKLIAHSDAQSNFLSRYKFIILSVSTGFIVAVVAIIILVKIHRKKKMTNRNRNNVHATLALGITDNNRQLQAAEDSAVNPSVEGNRTDSRQSVESVEMEATVLYSVKRKDEGEIVYADLALKQSSPASAGRLTKQPKVYAQFNLRSRGEDKTQDKDHDEECLPPVPPRMPRRPQCSPVNQWQTDMEWTPSPDGNQYLEDFL